MVYHKAQPQKKKKIKKRNSEGNGADTAADRLCKGAKTPTWFRIHQQESKNNKTNVFDV